MTKKEKSPKNKAAKKFENVKCAKCGLEFPDAEISAEHQNIPFVWDDMILCKDCLVMSGGNPGTASVWEPFHNEGNEAKPHDW